MNLLGSDFMEPIELLGLGMAAYFAVGIVAAFAGTAYLVKRYGWPPLPAELRALALSFARRKRPKFNLDGFRLLRSNGPRRLLGRQYETKHGLWTVEVECDGDEPIAFQGRLKHRFTPWLDGCAEGWSREPKLIMPDSGS